MNLKPLGDRVIVNLVPVPVKVGDKVVYGKFGGTEINVEGEDVLILRGDDLYAVFA